MDFSRFNVPKFSDLEIQFKDGTSEFVNSTLLRFKSDYFNSQFKQKVTRSSPPVRSIKLQKESYIRLFKQFFIPTVYEIYPFEEEFDKISTADLIKLVDMSIRYQNRSMYDRLEALITEKRLSINNAFRFLYAASYFKRGKSADWSRSFYWGVVDFIAGDSGTLLAFLDSNTSNLINLRNVVIEDLLGKFLEARKVDITQLRIVQNHLKRREKNLDDGRGINPDVDVNLGRLLNWEPGENLVWQFERASDAPPKVISVVPSKVHPHRRVLMLVETISKEMQKLHESIAEAVRPLDIQIDLLDFDGVSLSNQSTRMYEAVILQNFRKAPPLSFSEFISRFVVEGGSFLIFTIKSYSISSKNSMYPNNFVGRISHIVPVTLGHSTRRKQDESPLKVGVVLDNEHQIMGGFEMWKGIEGGYISMRSDCMTKRSRPKAQDSLDGMSIVYKEIVQWDNGRPLLAVAETSPLSAWDKGCRPLYYAKSGRVVCLNLDPRPIKGGVSIHPTTVLVSESIRWMLHIKK